MKLLCIAVLLAAFLTGCKYLENATGSYSPDAGGGINVPIPPRATPTPTPLPASILGIKKTLEK